MIENKDNYPSNEGAKPSNRLKNRYKDVLPCKLKLDIKKNFFNLKKFFLDDKHRVILQSDNDSDYINASFVEVNQIKIY